MFCKLKQKGFVPIVLIIILTIVIVGVARAVYVSKKEVRINQGGQTETAQPSSRDNSSIPLKITEGSDISVGLVKEPFELKADGGTLAVPEFSIYAPSGWVKLPPSGDDVVAFEAPKEDKIAFGGVYIYVKPRVNVNVLKRDYQNLDAFLSDSKSNWVKGNIEITNTQKTKLGSEEAYFLEGIINVGEAGRSEFEAQMKQEISKSGKKISEEKIKEDLNKALDSFKVKVAGYIVYKDGYGITISGKALLPVWDKREEQLKESMGSFKLLNQ